MVTNIIKEKVQNNKMNDKRLGLPHIEDLVGRNSFGSNRLSKDSIGVNRERQKSNAHLRLIHDLNKLAATPTRDNDDANGVILPPPPPPPGNGLITSFLPPPLPPPLNLTIPNTLPPPPSFLPPPLPIGLPPPFNLPLSG